MQRLNLTLPTPAENVALDEALLDWAEEDPSDREVLRIWESPQPLVVAGRSSRIEQEINAAECEERHIPIVRRSSGGAAIVAGPGCLMYAVVLSYQARPELRDIGRAHCFVLDRLATAIGDCGIEVARAGTSDLALADCGSQIADLSNLRPIRNPKSEIRDRSQVLRQQPAREAEPFPLSRHAALRLRPGAYRELPANAAAAARLPRRATTSGFCDESAAEPAATCRSPRRGLAHDRRTHRRSRCRAFRNLVANRFGRDSWNFEFRVSQCRRCSRHRRLSPLCFRRRSVC